MILINYSGTSEFNVIYYSDNYDSSCRYSYRNDPTIPDLEFERLMAWLALRSKEGIEECRLFHDAIKIRVLATFGRLFNRRSSPRWSSLRWKSIT